MLHMSKYKFSLFEPKGKLGKQMIFMENFLTVGIVSINSLPPTQQVTVSGVSTSKPKRHKLA